MNRPFSSPTLFDSNFPIEEQLPRIYDVHFREISRGKVAIYINNKQIGDVLTDNSYNDDGYRFHDIFHFSYAAILGWSPCVRKMLNRKRKSDSKVDEVQDGARAIITEEAISLLVYKHAQENNFFADAQKIDVSLLKTIVKLTNNFEVQSRSLLQWEKAILAGYSGFRFLVRHKNGVIRINMLKQELLYFSN